MTIPIQGRLTYNQQLIISVTTVVLVLAFLSYGLRLYARRIAGAKVWWDDHMIAGGLVRNLSLRLLVSSDGVE